VTGEPIVVGPFLTVNVTVPSLTVVVLETVAESATVWLLALKGAVALAATVVVAPKPTLRVWVLSLLARKAPPPE
jgi:hypothetical protein